MSDSQEKINQLQARLDKMVEYQQYFFREINAIQNEIKDLRKSQGQSPNTAPPVFNQNVSNQPAVPKTEPQIDIPKEVWQTINQPPPKREQGYSNQPPFSNRQQPNPVVKNKSSIEEFIGKNLFSLIGIIITVIGVAIGAKYAIDRDLISPATRIILGYLFAFTFLVIALRLKSKYLTFSAVLLSGSMAMMYFLTYFAYSFYSLIPQSSAFLMMVITTIFTVVAAISYNRQVIAHIGLVGAYAVPFLLSEGSGRAEILFSYMTIVNLGIFFVSVKKFWKPLFFTSFIFTWLIYSAWYAAKYNSQYFYIALFFLTVFFLTFYLIFAVYKLTARQDFGYEIIGLILVNATIFYAFGYQILNDIPSVQPLLGFFTIGNSIIHFIFAIVIYRYRLGGKINFYLPVALSLIFLTIAFPIQTKGNWTTLYWTAEAFILFALGRIKRLAIFEYFSYPVMFFASTALLFDWLKAALKTEAITPLFNADFVVTAFFVTAFGLIWFLNRHWKDTKFIPIELNKFLGFVFAVIFLFALYNLFRVEISNYFHNELAASTMMTTFGYPITDSSVRNSSVVWQINYTMLFLTVLSLFNIYSIKSAALGFINIALNTFLILFFLTVGLYIIGDLRDSYLSRNYAEYFNRGVFHLLIRYVSFIFLGGLIFANYKYFQQAFLREKIPQFPFRAVFDISFHITMLWLLTAELLNLTEIFRIDNSYKFGISILWGFYALILIVSGIFQKKVYLRVMAIVLFTLTLMKLFFYDIVNIGTILKTIIFISLGILLLIIAFLYNKFKDLIFEKKETEQV